MGANVTRRVLACALVCALAMPFATPALVSAAPTQAEIDAKKAEGEQARRDLEQMRVELSRKVDEYVRLGRRLERTQIEIAEVEAQIAEVDAELEAKRQAVVNRAVELYRSDRDSMLILLLEAESLNDLFMRYRYVSIINDRDSRLMREMKLARVESAWLHSSLSDREGYMLELQQLSDDSREQIEKAIETQELRAQEIGADLAAMMRSAAAAAAAAQLASRMTTGSADAEPGGEFTPDTLITEANFRAATSMNVEEIQAFLERQGGVLARYRGPDHAGQTKTAAQMIAEAAVAWNVSPKVILVTLQKEQSLLSRPNPSSYAFDWAMGCGKTDSRTFTQYRGFGNQIWHGARVLDKNAGPYRPGIELTITGSIVRPTNPATYTLYKYTPHMRGNMSFWLIHWRHFGDPLAR
ncbi:MAG: hypothetical protein U1E29_00045 [Coriobacteriia bacterium]|nr:hypothetical protein [Coriobacteriia bacterium]